MKRLLLLTALFALVSGCGDGNPSQNNAAETIRDERDGSTYRAVKMPNGTVWTAQNLNYDVDGSWAYCDDEANAAIYGRLYTWEAAKTVCPAGWRLPERWEWAAMINSAGGKDIAGKKLKAKIGWNDGNNGTDIYGFSALPGGYRDRDGNFYGIGDFGYWWTATKYGDRTSNICGDKDFDRDIPCSFNFESSGYSVRCIKDQ